MPGHELLAGVLTYASGLVAGLFRPMSTRPEALLELGEGTHPGAAFQTRGGRVRYDRLVVRRLEFDDALTGGPPVALDADVAGIAVGLGGASALAGLPPTVKGTAGLTYRLDVSNREFHLDRLSIDLPGLVTIDLAFGLCSVGPGLPEPELSVADVGLTHLRVRIRDRGLVPRVESTVAWAQGFVGDGVLGAVSPSGDSELARALASWLGTSGPCDLEVSCRPSSPITVAHLESSGLRDLGLDVRFRRESTRSVHS